MDWENITSSEYVEGANEEIQPILMEIDQSLAEIEILTTGHNVLSRILSTDDADLETAYSYYRDILDGVTFADPADMLFQAGASIEGVISAIGSAIKRAWDAIIGMFKKLFNIAKNGVTVSKARSRIKELNDYLHNGAEIYWKKDFPESDEELTVYDYVDPKMLRHGVLHMEKQHAMIYKILRQDPNPTWTLTYNSIRAKAPGKLSAVVNNLDAKTQRLTSEQIKELRAAYTDMSIRVSDFDEPSDAIEQIIKAIELYDRMVLRLGQLNDRIEDVRFDKIFKAGESDQVEITKKMGRVITMGKGENVCPPMTYLRTYAYFCKLYIQEGITAMRHLEAMSRSQFTITEKK